MCMRAGDSDAVVLTAGRCSQNHDDDGGPIGCVICVAEVYLCARLQLAYVEVSRTAAIATLGRAVYLFSAPVFEAQRCSQARADRLSCERSADLGSWWRQCKHQRGDVRRNGYDVYR